MLSVVSRKISILGVRSPQLLPLNDALALDITGAFV